MIRYAVYYAPPPGAFADRAAAWLGWDPVRGQDVAQPVVTGLPVALPALTGAPRKYGFHGTLRAPFRLAEALDEAALHDHLTALARTLSPVVMEGLGVTDLEGFVALTPVGDGDALRDLAARVVTGTDPLRAALTPDEIARRSPDRLTAPQRAHLDRWGYPFVMEEFQFHLTLTGALPPAQSEAVRAVVAAHFAPVLPRPFVIGDICLFGEDTGGRFHLLHRYALSS